MAKKKKGGGGVASVCAEMRVAAAAALVGGWRALRDGVKLLPAGVYVSLGVE